MAFLSIQWVCVRAGGRTGVHQPQSSSRKGVCLNITGHQQDKNIHEGYGKFTELNCHKREIFMCESYPDHSATTTAVDVCFSALKFSQKQVEMKYICRLNYAIPSALAQSSAPMNVVADFQEKGLCKTWFCSNQGER